MNKPVLAIAGPTGSGKSDLALYLGQELRGEIVNIDSVQVYTDFDIGSAKPSLEERRAVAHHLYDIARPDEPLNAAKYGKLATDVIQELQSRNSLPILVGGSTMYITTLFHGLAEIPSAADEIKQRISQLSDHDLYERLSEVDPARADQLHPNDRVRVARAVESFESSGRVQSDLLAEHRFAQKCFVGLFIVPIWPRLELYARIDRRSEQMISAGLVAEVQTIVDRYGPDVQPLRSLGYAQVLAMTGREINDRQLAAEISLYTRRFAKRQMTYWRNEPVKRGWDIWPTQDKPRKEVGRRAGSAEVEFATMALSRSELLAKVRMQLSSSFERSQVWFVDAQKLAI